MKKPYLKRIMAVVFVLALCVVSGLLLWKQKEVKATAENPYTEYIDIGDYKDRTKTPKPQDGAHKEWIFAGWYEDPTCESPIVNLAEISGKQYAKFIASDVLSVKCQVTANTTKDTEVTNLRVVTTIDGLNYKRVGFEFCIGNSAPFEYDIYSVFEKIVATEETDNFIHTPDEFHESAKYFATVTFTGIPDASYQDGIRITPYLVTLDGTKIYGVGRYARVEDSYEKILNMPVKLYSDEKVAAGYLEVDYDEENYQFIQADDGTVFEKVSISDTGSVIRCVGYTQSKTDNQKADGMYVNLRFQLTTTPPEDDVIFPVLKEEFCDFDENPKDINVFDAKYKILDGTGINREAADVWGCESTYKVLQNVDNYEAYNSSEKLKTANASASILTSSNDANIQTEISKQVEKGDVGKVAMISQFNLLSSNIELLKMPLEYDTLRTAYEASENTANRYLVIRAYTTNAGGKTLAWGYTESNASEDFYVKTSGTLKNNEWVDLIFDLDSLYRSEKYAEGSGYNFQSTITLLDADSFKSYDLYISEFYLTKDNPLEAKEPSIELDVAKGEYEAYQIIISANEDIYYDFYVDKLVNENNTVFSTKQVDVFHEKYINVETDYNGEAVPGMYPDAIVPLKNIKECGENVVNAGENQGIYVRFHIPKDQEPGVYTGTFVVEISGGYREVPVTLRVHDVTVPEENNMKSIYMVNYGSWMGEQDGSQDMLSKYTEFLYEYRLSSANIMLDNAGTDEDVKYYTDLAYEHMQNPKCSFVVIPFLHTGYSVTKEFSQKYLYEFARKSFATGYNMFEKTGTYIGTIDEPDSFGVADDIVQRTSEDWTALCEEVAAVLEADQTITSPIKAQVVEGIRNCRNVVTTADVERYNPLGVTTFCAKFSDYDTAEERSVFAENSSDLWWYGCIDPKEPYPSFEIDQQSLTNIHLMGWMASDYDITGNLFWAADFYAKASSEIGMSNTPLEDYYDTAERFPNTNGDGFLMYPGARYGVDGPVASLRLEAIRDGLEDYELLNVLKKNNQKFSNTSSLYDGTKATAGVEVLTAARKQLLELSE